MLSCVNLLIGNSSLEMERVERPHQFSLSVLAVCIFACFLLFVGSTWGTGYRGHCDGICVFRCVSFIVLLWRELVQWVGKWVIRVLGALAKMTNLFQGRDEWPKVPP